jgi:Uma2 family endonuclease
MNHFDINTLEGQDMPSLNHSLLQARLVKLIDERFVPLTELSLDITSLAEVYLKSLSASKEIQPDICLYAADDKDIHFIDAAEADDLIRVNKMPLLAVEILSPTQGNKEILAKLRAYFALGIKSCWVVDPGLKIVAVYDSPNDSRVYQFTDPEVVDKTLDIHLPMQKLFAKWL